MFRDAEIHRWRRSRQFHQIVSQAAPLGLVLSLTLAVRAPGLGRPLLGVFATKNVIYAMIARNWALGASSACFPALDCLKGGGLALHMLEFPVSAYLSGLLWWLGGGSLDVWGRLTSIGFSLGSAALLYGLCRRWHGRGVALVAAAVFGLSPVSIVYGQAFMLEASLVFFALATIWSFDRWLHRGNWVWLGAATAMFALALLTKIYLLVLILPLATMLRRRGVSENRAFKAAAAAIALACALIPAALWYAHAADVAGPGSPLANRVFYSVRESAEVHRPPHPLLWSPRFYAGVVGDLGTVVLTPVGLLLAVVGLFRTEARRHLAWLTASGLLILLLPRKFHEMNYYYLPVLPPLCILAALGAKAAAVRWAERPTRLAAMAVASAVLALRYSVGPAYHTPAEDRTVMAAAETLQRRCPPDDLVVTIHGSTLDLLYYCQRRGWFLQARDSDLKSQLHRCAEQGANWLVVAETEPRECRRIETEIGVSSNESASGYGVYSLDRLRRDPRIAAVRGKQDR